MCCFGRLSAELQLSKIIKRVLGFCRYLGALLVLNHAASQLAISIIPRDKAMSVDANGILFAIWEGTNGAAENRPFRSRCLNRAILILHITFYIMMTTQTGLCHDTHQ